MDLIECVKVYEDRRIEVVFRYADECEKTMRLLESLPVDVREQAAV